jgi:5'-AMP-activated protein kinase, catalytic alpha subunit
MLGRGAFGKVNLAMHKLTRRLVAIKCLNKEQLTDETQKKKVMKEVYLLLKLRHDNVVKIYQEMEAEKHIIIAMELCAGGDLLNYVRKRRRLKEPYAKAIFKQIIDGLCYIHSKRVCHRDIKLDNILLDGRGVVKIADFGVSKQATRPGEMFREQCGTPAYIAPEILRDKGYSYNVDLWSAGVVLFAMLYGTVPFKANNMDELHKLILKGRYSLKDDISTEARSMLRGLLEVNPVKRLNYKQIYKHPWLADVDTELNLFSEMEKDMIKKEYTYNDPRRYNRNENEEPNDNTLKNVSTKSIILAPFNST